MNERACERAKKKPLLSQLYLLGKLTAHHTPHTTTVRLWFIFTEENAPSLFFLSMSLTSSFFGSFFFLFLLSKGTLYFVFLFLLFLLGVIVLLKTSPSHGLEHRFDCPFFYFILYILPAGLFSHALWTSRTSPTSISIMKTSAPTYRRPPLRSMAKTLGDIPFVDWGLPFFLSSSLGTEFVLHTSFNNNAKTLVKSDKQKWGDPRKT